LIRLTLSVSTPAYPIPMPMREQDFPEVVGQALE
jgi:hypothetical protein